MVIKRIDKRFGTIAVEKGFITIPQLMDAFEIQVKEDVAGVTHRLIGRILYDLGFLTIPQIEQVLDAMDSYNVSKHSEMDDDSDE
jgi:hypothetical protein